MRKPVTLLSTASTPYQFRQTLCCSYALLPSTSSCPSPSWLLSPHHDRIRSRPLSTSASLAYSATATASDPRTHHHHHHHPHHHHISSSNSSSANPVTTRPPDRQPQARDRTIPALPALPYKFETGISLFAKRPPRPFPPPFLSPPSGSFSDPLSTHHRSRDRRPKVNGELIKGWTNGDDAAFASEYFIGANDGVGAWSARPRGHAGLWARLVLHFWATAMSEDAARPRGPSDPAYRPDPVAYLQRAYELTREATSEPDWQGTTTATGAQLFYGAPEENGKAEEEAEGDGEGERGHPHHSAGGGSGGGGSGVAPVLYVTNLGDSQVMVVRPSSGELVFKTREQWHWFDCPRQLGTNSPDTPLQNAVLDRVPIREGDVVLAMSDGVIDNLWSHEIVENVSTSIRRWEAGEGRAAKAKLRADRPEYVDGSGEMAYVAEELMLAAKAIALDPFAESPFMEHAIEEGLPSEGGKLDDISVVAARCMRNNDFQ